MDRCLEIRNYIVFIGEEELAHHYWRVIGGTQQSQGKVRGGREESRYVEGGREGGREGGKEGGRKERREGGS